MRHFTVVLGLAALLAALPISATTYSGGFKDATGPESDNDFNDLVFSLRRAALTLNTANGTWLNRSSARATDTSLYQPGYRGITFTASGNFVLVGTINALGATLGPDSSTSNMAARDSYSKFAFSNPASSAPAPPLAGIPEPSTLALLTLAFAGTGIASRRKLRPR